MQTSPCQYCPTALRYTSLCPECIPARMASPAYFHDPRASRDLEIYNQPDLCGLCRHTRLRHVVKHPKADELINTRFYFRSFPSTSAVCYVGWCASPGGFGARTTWPFITPNLVCTLHASVLCGWPILNLRITTGLRLSFTFITDPETSMLPEYRFRLDHLPTYSDLSLLMVAPTVFWKRASIITKHVNHRRVSHHPSFSSAGHRITLHR
jgi:hypothetical protein